MNAIQLTGLLHMQMQQIETPRIENDTDVLIRLRSVGVCGSDVHYFAEGKIGTQIVEFPWILGHEASGTVEAIGSAVRRVKVGDRIAIDPAMPCWTCDQCLAGRSHTCRNLRFLACPGQAEGCLSDYVVMPETSCFVVPAGMTFDQAAIVEPLSIGVHAVNLSKGIAGATIGILGSGPIGMCVMLAARAAGAARVLMTDKIDARLAIAKDCGADWVGNPNSDDILDLVKLVRPKLLDIVFECSGAQDAIDQGPTLLAPGGQFLLIGIPSTDRISFDINVLRRKEITVQNVRRQNECVQSAIDLIASGRAPVDFMITHHFPFERAQEAFDLVHTYGDGVVKAMIEVE
jgi:L-iditol 2-dehydrogenase